MAYGCGFLDSLSFLQVTAAWTEAKENRKGSANAREDLIVKI